ncbi:hypothetical protein QAD02_008875 [Eretmocerus hayati]|uniref:Uncharacterized protein n=1 Tax=Eretmocerus hayati TaxID=131215 RepID=A0ACC2N8F8_9HYME|nr:hypothetical protein QAD02_008875 [Eretmocerus hayati]
MKLLIFFEIWVLLQHVSSDGTSTLDPLEGSSRLVEQEKDRLQDCTDQETCSCRNCGATFDQRRKLVCHILNYHPGERAYSCRYCIKAFAWPTNLKNHERTHTGEKPYSCDLCHKKFSEKGALKKHAKMHTSAKSLLPCKYCGVSFIRLMCLKEHVSKIHADDRMFSCDLCNERFGTRLELRSHTTAHAKKKPYLCEICGLKFDNKGDLECHTKVHLGEVIYKCKYCDKKYKYSQNLNKHMVKHLKTDTGDGPSSQIELDETERTWNHLGAYAGWECGIENQIETSSDEPSWMSLNPTISTSLVEQGSGMMNEVNCLIEELDSLDHELFMTGSGISSHPEEPSLFSRIALQSRGSTSCETEDTVPENFQRVIDEIIRSYHETQRANCERKTPDQFSE